MTITIERILAHRQLMDDLPRPLITAWERAVNSICDRAERQHIPPRALATLLAYTLAGLCVVDVRDDVTDEAGVNAFITFCNEAVGIATAERRLAAGLNPIEH